MTIRHETRKIGKTVRHRRIEPFTLLEGVLGAFSTNSIPRYRTAVTSLLREGPLLVDVFVYHALDNWPDEAIVRLRAEFVALFQSVAKDDRASVKSDGIGTASAMTFKPQSTRGAAAVLAAGQIRDIVVLQAVIALHLVGLKNLRTCKAGDCRLPFITRWGKEHCSVRCQKRTERRRNREAARKQERRRLEREQRRRRGR